MELATPGSAVRLASVARHVTDCATWPVPLVCGFMYKGTAMAKTSVDADVS